jgi:hypothetical protein
MKSEWDGNDWRLRRNKSDWSIAVKRFKMTTVFMAGGALGMLVANNDMNLPEYIAMFVGSVFTVAWCEYWDKE